MSATSTPVSHKPAWQAVWIVITCGCIIAMMTFGVRSAMGFFQAPMLADTGWSRTTFGLAMAIQQLLWGVTQPIMGAVADRYGTWRVLTFGAVVYAVGNYMMAVSSAPIWLHVGGGVLVGIGVGSASFGIILAAFARTVSPEQRSFVFGVGTAAASLGMFVFAPISQGLIESLGWSDTLTWFAVLMLIIPVLALPLIGSARSGGTNLTDDDLTIREALAEAFSTRGYVLLTIGFFVCGFHVAFLAVHFPAYVNDLGIDTKWAVVAIALIGGFNVIGSLAAGIIGQRYSKPVFLALIYIGRSIAFTLFLLIPASPTTVVIFAVAMGFLWLSTVPPTNALVAVMFGTRHLGLLGGLVFFNHQIGSFLGVWLGGYLYDIMGSYDVVWWIGVALGLIAAILHWPIKEQPVPRLASAAA
ncbi:MAG: MFS transporter [Pseudomonadota bacterium]